MEQIAVQGEYLLKVLPDDEPLDPRVECDNFGTMVCFHRRYRLGDVHQHRDADQFLFSLLAEGMGNEAKAERFFEQAAKGRQNQYSHGGYDRAVHSILLKEIEKTHVILPLYLYDHSGITMNTTGFSCPWDSGQVGWIYVTKEKVLAEYGGKLLTNGKREKAESMLRAEVDYYDSYLSGECYGYELYKSGEQIESCWGFMGSPAEVRDAIQSCLPDECRGMVDRLEEAPPPRGHSVRELMALAQARQQPPAPPQARTAVPATAR